MNPFSRPQIAISNKVFAAPQDLLAYCRRHHSRAIDFSFAWDAQKPADIQREVRKLATLAANDFEIRYHCPFFLVEMAHRDSEKAREALSLLQHCIDLAADFGGKYMTVHIGLGRSTSAELAYETALSYLSKLVEYGAGRDLTVCLENLPQGWTSSPHRLLAMLEKTGARGTFDLGHANACQWVVEQRGTGVGFLEIIASHVDNAHVYEVERIDEQTSKPYHVPPRNLETLEEMLSRLMETQCDWWLIELSGLEEVNSTLALLKTYLEAKTPVAAGNGEQIP